MVQVYEEKHKIHGTLYFNGQPYELLRPSPERISSVAWNNQDTFLFYVINPDGYGTSIYVHGSFLVDFANQGAMRSVKFTIDDEKEATTDIDTVNARIQELTKSI